MGILFSSAISIEKYESSVSVSSTHLPSGSRLHEPCNRGARTRNLRRSESYIVEEERQRSKACNPKANYIGRQLCARGIAGVLPMPDHIRPCPTWCTVAGCAAVHAVVLDSRPWVR